MTDTRAWKVANIANDVPDIDVAGEADASVLVLGWGSTFGSIRAACNRTRKQGNKVASAHLRHLNPLPNNLGRVLSSYDKILIPELNTGQLLKVIRAEFLIDAVGLNQVTGEPFKVTDIEDKIVELSK